MKPLEPWKAWHLILFTLIKSSKLGTIERSSTTFVSTTWYIMTVAINYKFISAAMLVCLPTFVLQNTVNIHSSLRPILKYQCWISCYVWTIYFIQISLLCKCTAFKSLYTIDLNGVEYVIFQEVLQQTSIHHFISFIVLSAPVPLVISKILVLR